MLDTNYWFEIADPSRRELFQNQLVRTFYWHAAYALSPEQIQFSKELGHTTANLFLDGKVVNLRRQKFHQSEHGRSYTVVSRPHGNTHVDYVFEMLDADNFLFIPAADLPLTETIFPDTEKSFHQYTTPNNSRQRNSAPNCFAVSL